MELTVEERLIVLANGDIIIRPDGCKFKLENSSLVFCMTTSDTWYKASAYNQIFDKDIRFVVFNPCYPLMCCQAMRTAMNERKLITPNVPYDTSYYFDNNNLLRHKDGNPGVPKKCEIETMWRSD